MANVRDAERELMRSAPAKELADRVNKEARGPKSKAILLESLKYESPAHIYYAVFRTPPVIERGKGSKVWDVDGNEYIDLIGGFSTQNVGHIHPKVTETIKKQSELLVQEAELPHEYRTKLAKRLVEITPGKFEKKVQYVTTGGEATETALRLARYYTQHPTIIGFFGGYHGRTYGAMNVTMNAYMRHFEVMPLNQAVFHVPYAYCYRCPFGLEYADCGVRCVKFIDEMFKANQFGLRSTKAGGATTNVAAMIVEPMQAHSGYIVPPPEFMPGLREICDKYGILLIADEIQTGFGRTGKWWACDQTNVAPDIMAIGKSIAAGLPLSVVVAKSEIWDAMGPASVCTTFGGTPLSCAAALTVLDVFEQEKLLERAAKIGEYFKKGFEELQSRHPLIGHVNGVGLFIGVDLVKDPKTREPAPEANAVIHDECFKRGLLYERGGYYGNMIKTICPLCITEEEVDKTLDIFDQAMKVTES
jgi:4-aminobutyrate aminotransferase